MCEDHVSNEEPTYQVRRGERGRERERVTGREREGGGERERERGREGGREKNERRR